MATTNKDTLKGYFKAGSIPTEANFIDLVDSVLSENGNKLLFIDNANDKIGIGTNTPAYKLTIEAPGGFGSENEDGTTKPGNVPLVLKCNSTAFGILNANNRQAFALNIDGNDGTTRGRGIPTFYDKYNGTWNPSICLKNGNVGIGTNNPVAKLEIVGQIKISGGAPEAGRVLTSDANGLATWVQPSIPTNFSSGNFSGNMGVNTMRPIGPLTVGDSGVDGSDGFIVIGKKQGSSTRHFRIGYDKDFNCQIGDYGANQNPGSWKAQFSIHWQAPDSSLSINNLGNVGFGLSNPKQKIEIGGNGGLGFSGLNLNSADKKLYSPADGDLEWMTHNSAGVHGFAISHQGTKAVYLNTSGNSYLNGGNVGIGTNNPVRGKLEIGSWASFSFAPVGGIGTDGRIMGPQGSGNWGTAIWAEGKMSAHGYFVPSDLRIKEIGKKSNSREDLEIIKKIEITDYQMKDQITKGNAKYKKVIAQQVMDIFPQSISLSTDVIPDIYQLAQVKNGWIKLVTNLRIGEKVQLIFGSDKKLFEVLETSQQGFKVETTFEGNVFVYGREVYDFHSVDYEAISMLNVSATQELAIQLETLKSENEILKSDLNEMKEFLTISKN